MSSAAKVALLVLFAPVLTGCWDPASGEGGLDSLRTELKAAGYDLIYPLTTGYNVGSIYEIGETGEGTQFRRTLCEAAFVNAEPNEADLRLATYESNQDASFEFFAGLSEKLLKDRATAQATLKASNVRKTSVSFPNLKSSELPPQLRPDGTKRSVDPTCEINIRNATDGEGKFLNPAYLVVGAARTDTLQYEFESGGSIGADVEVQIKALFKVEPKVTGEASGKKTLVVQPDEGKQFVLGGQAIALSHAKILYEVAEGFPIALEVDEKPQIAPSDTFALPEG
jgi:hypothetical protein